MKKKWRVLLLAAALPLVLCGCMMSASVDDLYALPQLPEEYKALSARLSEVLALGADLDGFVNNLLHVPPPPSHRFGAIFYH